MKRLLYSFLFYFFVTNFILLSLLSALNARFASRAKNNDIENPKYNSNGPKEVPARLKKRKGRITTMADVATDQIELKQEQKEIQPGVAEKIDKISEQPEGLDSKNVYLEAYLQPWKDIDYKEVIEGINYEDAELREYLTFLENNLNVKFILDDTVKPGREGNKTLGGTKITFRSHTPINLKEAWDLGLTFLEMAGFSVVPGPLERTYRVVDAAGKDKSANKEPLPTFIGVNPELLPSTDIKIRYVYFVENAELDTILKIVQAMKSQSAADPIAVPELRAILMTDKSINIKSLLNVVKEVDMVTMPETLAIIRLRHTDANSVTELWNKLIGKDEQQSPFSPYRPQRKPPTTQYFNETTRVIPEPRTNTLIVLGTRENIKKFEEFVLRYIDKTQEIPFSPLHVVRLRFIDATSTANILMESITKFNSYPANTAAAIYGGIRDSSRFFRPSVRITAEPSGNRLIINSDYEEYLKLLEIIEKLDVEQPQVAIKVLILDVELTNLTQLGTQLRNKVNCCDNTGILDPVFGRQVNFQFAGLGGIVPNVSTATPPPVGLGAQRLLGNLLTLADAQDGVSIFPRGTTLLTFGRDLFGYSVLIRALEQFARVSVIANPFLVTTNKYEASVKVGETRRVLSAIVQGQSQAASFTNLDANLEVRIKPQISYDDMVQMEIMVELAQFLDPIGEVVTPTGASQNANRLIKRTSTQVLAANKEVVALGGLIRDRAIENVVGVPLLKDIPLFGWLFKSKIQEISRSSLLILISPEIIKPTDPNTAQVFTYEKVADAKQTLYMMQDPAANRDPIHRWLFTDHIDKEANKLDQFISRQKRYLDETQKARREVIASDTANSSRKKRLLELVDQRTQSQPEVVT